MAATMWRMNGLRKGVAVALLLCVLLINSGARCQNVTADPTTGEATGANVLPAVTVPDGLAINTNTGGTPGNATEAEETSTGTKNVDPMVDTEKRLDVKDSPLAAAPPEARITPHKVVPKVICVAKKDMEVDRAVSANVNTSNCEDTKKIFEEYSAHWCSLSTCTLNIFQENNTIWVASPDIHSTTLDKALQSEPLKGKLGASNVKTPGSTVFVGVLLAGLFLAAALIGGYCLKIRRGTDAKGVRLAEEAYPVDEQNQGNTLVSVAPLSTPDKPESQEKPSVNGETAEPTPEAPPSNGHSSAKTADTEL